MIDPVEADALPEVSTLGPQQIRSLRESRARVNIFEGAIRSGKTIVSLLRFLLAVIVARGGAIVVVARTRDSAYRNVFEPLMTGVLFGSLSRLIHYTAGAPTARVLGRTVHVLGANDRNSEKVLRGLTVALAYVDEVTVIPEEFFTQLLGRMSPPKAKLFGTTNPDSPAHWLKVKFLDRITTGTLPGWLSWHFVLDDNPALTETYKAQIKSEFTGLWFKRFILGEWVAAEGAILDMWDVEKHVVPWDQLPQMQQLICVGVDYGTTNPTAALLLGLSAELDQYNRPAPRLYFVDEFRHDSKVSQEKLTDAELGRKLAEWLAQEHLPASTTARLSPRHVILDPSAASLAVELRKAQGITTTAADNDVLYGIRTMASLLAERRLLVSDRCKGFITEAPGYAWDEKATLKGEDKPIKVADHSLDAGRYAITTTENIWRQHIRLAA